MYICNVCHRYGSIISLNSRSQLINIWVFPKRWYPTTIGFPTKNDHFGLFLGVPPLFSRTLFPHDLWVTAAADNLEPQRKVPINGQLSTTEDPCCDENGIAVSGTTRHSLCISHQIPAPEGTCTRIAEQKSQADYF